MEPRVYEPSDGTRIVAHVVYGLHTVSILLGLMTGASIAGAFHSGSDPELHLPRRRGGDVP